MARTAIIAGMGPGFGEAFAWKLAREGYRVGMFARSEDYLEAFAADLRDAGHEALAVPTDITEPKQVTRGFDRVRKEFGPVDVLSNQASDFGGDSSFLSPEYFELAWRTYTYGALLCSQEAVADMRETGGGTVIFCGATPGTGDFAYASAKAGTQRLAEAMARELGPKGIHVAHLLIGGGILNPDVYEETKDVNEEEYMDPESVVETCWHLIEQEKDAWTFELDLRPHVEEL